MDDHDDTVRRLHDLGAHPIDPAQSVRDLTAMAGARPAGRLSGKLRLAGAFLAGLLIGSTGLAAADALPDPAQHVAHTVLGRVGVEVPDPERYHGPECGAEVKRNHGAYVRDDHNLAQSDCGKKAKAAGADESDEDDDHGRAPEAGQKSKAPKGPCQGKPPWAGNSTMTAEERAAAQAERAAQCGSDDPAETDTETDAPAATGTDAPAEADAPAPAPTETDAPAVKGTDAPAGTDSAETEPDTPSGVG